MSRGQLMTAANLCSEAVAVQNSMTSRFIICIFYFIIWARKPPTEVREFEVFDL